MFKLSFRLISKGKITILYPNPIQWLIIDLSVGFFNVDIEKVELSRNSIISYQIFKWLSLHSKATHQGAHPLDSSANFFNTLNNLLPITYKAHITNCSRQWIGLDFRKSDVSEECVLLCSCVKERRVIRPLRLPGEIGWMTITFSWKPFPFTFAHWSSKYFV